jgi:hypothetical protein
MSIQISNKNLANLQLILFIKFNDQTKEKRKEKKRKEGNY